jgi:GNAT superfamily N-acetyltransferase
VEFHIEDHPDPLDIEILEAQIRREASAAMGLGDEVELAIFVREARTVVAGISGWTWGNCCELQSLWVEPSLRGRGLATRLLAAAEAEAAGRGCSQTVHFTYDFQARALYERNGYELVGRVEDFPAGTDVLWYRKTLNPRGVQADLAREMASLVNPRKPERAPRPARSDQAQDVIESTTSRHNGAKPSP